jgi:hypothetical protein
VGARRRGFAASEPNGDGRRRLGCRIAAWAGEVPLIDEQLIMENRKIVDL